jgi:hypothetical protein
MLAELSLEPEFRRGHGALYDAVNCGEVQVARLRRALSALPLPAWDDGRIRLAADVSNWLWPDAEASPERLFCHCYARGKGNGDPDILVVFDSGYDLTRHTFRFLKQVLGWTRSKLRDPAAADQWTWIVIACYAQLRLARSLAADLRLPWQQPCPPGRLTPARVRRGFRSIRQTLSDLASAPKPGKPGPGRPPGSKNSRPATRHDVGKTVKRTEPKKITRSQKG